MGVNKFLNISGLKQESLLDGNSMRTVIFFQGCSHACKGCQNKETHSFYINTLMSIKSLIAYIESDILSDGVTFSGGCPMCQKNLDDLIFFAKEIKKLNKDIWCYCGEKYEELNDKQKEFLQYIDVLIDGKFEIENRDINLRFRGSTNQRIIDVKKSLQKKEVVLWDE